MKTKTYLKTILLLLPGSLLLQNCGPNELPNGHCNKHWTLNEAHLKTLLFDYEHTDTLLYKRTINNVVTDTLVFVKQRNYRDVLKFHNGDADGDPACDRREFTRERIGWDYISQYDSIFFNVQVVALGEGSGNDDFFVHISNDFNLTFPLGSAIGNYSLKPFTTYSTSENMYEDTWWTLCVNKNELTPYGTTEYKNRTQLDWKCFYNIQHGYIEISKTDRTEVWELIP